MLSRFTQRSLTRGLLGSIVGVSLISAMPTVLASESYLGYWSTVVTTLPDGTTYNYSSSTTDDDANCALCHLAYNDGSSRSFNPYGQAIRNSTLSNLLDRIRSVESFDSDEDPCGYSNIEEIVLNAQPGWTDGDSAPFAGVLDPECGGGENDPPTVDAIADQFDSENDIVSLQVNASDLQGDPLSYSALGLPQGLSIDSSTGQISGTVAYDAVLHPDILHDYNVEVTVDDGTDTTTVTFLWTISDTNQNPIAVADSENTMEDTSVNIAVLDNDSDPDGDTLSTVIDTDPVHGTVTVNADETVTYTPDSGYNGDDSFDYAAVDGFGGSDIATVSINVSAVNDAPSITNPGPQDSSETDTVSLQIAASDPDGDNLTYSASGLPPTLSINASTGLISGSVSYTAVDHPAIQDIYTVTVEASDGINLPASATFDWAVSDLNQVPEAANDDGVVVHDNALNIDVLSNDSDADGDSLMVVSTSNPANGSVDINQDGSLTYTPDAGFVGDDSFTYTIEDGYGGNASATVQVTVTNIAPVAANDVYGTDQVTTLTVDAAHGVLANDSDADGDSLSVTLTADVSVGTLTLNVDGSFTYVPNGVASVTFKYVASDGIADSNEATVTINVSEVNLPPTIDPTPDQSDAETDLVSLQIVADDPNGDTLSYVALGLPANLSIDPDTGVISGTLSYDVVDHPDTSVTESVMVEVSDGQYITSVTFDWTVIDTNRNPVAGDDDAATDPNTEVTVAVLENDSDADGDSLSVASIVLEPLNGTVEINNDDSITYTPNDGFSGNDNFDYMIEDGFGGSDVATVNISVTNAAPVAVDDSYTTLQDQTLSVPAPGVLANDTDADGDTLTATLKTIPANGSVILNGNGSFSYTPKAGFSGEDSFTYEASDGVASDVATVTIMVTEIVLEAPVADAGGPYTGTEGIAVDFDGSDSSDADGNIVRYDWDFGDGSVAEDAGAFPSHAYSTAGNYTVTLTVTDNDGLTDSAEAGVTIYPVSIGDGDVFLSKMRLPSLMLLREGKAATKKITVYGDGDTTQEATVTLTASDPALAITIDPASVTEVVEPGRPDTRFNFSAEVTCLVPGNYVLEWTATIDAVDNADPSNDSLTMSTEVECKGSTGR